MSAVSGLPLMSIGVPVHNGAQFLAEALDSALAQDYPNLEVLISDNASTDATEAIGRRYAQQDNRVRYWRNPSNIGVAANFARVLAEAKGHYFTWLACDDLLSSPQYASKSIAFLEANPDVVLCACDLLLLDFEPQPHTRLMDLYPDRGPRQARRPFFVWPQTQAGFAIYGVYRRAALDGVPLTKRLYKGREINSDMELPIFLPLLKQGRIVALPEFLRSYRVRPGSTWQREHDCFSGLDRLMLSLPTRWFLASAAWRLPVSVGEKLALLTRTAWNFLGHNLRGPIDYSMRHRFLRREARHLRLAAEERRQAILSLRAEIDLRRALLRQHGFVEETEPWQQSYLVAAMTMRAWPLLERLRATGKEIVMTWMDFFRKPPPQRQSDWLQHIAENTALRRLCDERLHEIDKLTQEAERYQRLIDTLVHQATTAPFEAEACHA